MAVLPADLRPALRAHGAALVLTLLVGGCRKRGPTLGEPGPSPSAAHEAPACGRARSARTAPASRWDELRGALEGSPGDEGRLVEGFLRDAAGRGGMPLVDAGSERVVFVARRALVAEPLSVVGSFGAGVPMRRLGTSELVFAELTLPRGRPIHYAFAGAGAPFVDPLAKNVTWEAGTWRAIVRVEDEDPSRGRLVSFGAVGSAASGGARPAAVYLPAVYDQAPCPALPVLYFQDGLASLSEAPFQDAADREYAEHPEEAALLVFVELAEGASRDDEYTFGTDSARGDRYGDYLRDELRPALETSLRVCPSAADHGLAGASLGGLIAVHLALRDPGVWGFAAAQSGSFWWANGALARQVRGTPRGAVRFYLDSATVAQGCATGGADDDNCAVTETLFAALKAKGYVATIRGGEGAGHGFHDWQARLPGLLATFRTGRAGCTPTLSAPIASAHGATTSPRASAE